MLRPWFVVAAGRVALAAAWIAIGFAAWTAMASGAFLWMAGLMGDPSIPAWTRPYQWWVHAPWFGHSLNGTVYVGASAVAATLPLGALAVRGIAKAVRRARGPALKRDAWTRLVRGTSDNHGHAAWMTMDEARSRYPAPDPVSGGVVLGEAYRVDRDSVARVPFNPRPEGRHTWGQGGKAPLLVDPCTDGPGHVMTLAGAGGFKSSTLATTLVHPLGWRTSAVVMDPSCELGPIARRARERMGHRVVELVPGGGAGFDALGWIDTAHPEAEANVAAAVGWVVGMGAKVEAGEGGRWKGWGRDLVLCLASHLLWADETRPARHKYLVGCLPRLPPRRTPRRPREAVRRGAVRRLGPDMRAPLLPREFKTLRTLRAMVRTPADEMRKLLGVIHARSNSRAARDLAGTIKDLVEETFSGLYQNATADTAWLSNEAFAGLVSGSSFRPSDLAGGALTVLLQVPQKTLETTPAIARVVVGALLNAVFEADGAVRGRVLFALDEAVLLGPLPALKTALTQGRKYRIVLWPHYQDDGQVEEVWEAAGRRTWFSNLSWRLYAGISDLEVAKEVSEHCGGYAVIATTEGDNTGRSGKPMEAGSKSKGDNSSRQEVLRELIKPAEILHDMRADEAIVLPRGAKPLRCGRAIYFRRDDIMGAGLAGANRFAPAAAQPGAGGQER